MLGVTAFMTADVAPIPMLWILPLLLYILSFVLVFARWTPRADRLVSTVVPWMAGAVLFLVFTDFRRNMAAIIGLHLLGFFLVALACHGRLALRRPAPRRLTEFYLWLSLGGVLGGLVNALVAPLVFPRIAEYPLVLALAVMVLGGRIWPGRSAATNPVASGSITVGRRIRPALGSLAAAALFAGLLAGVEWLLAHPQLRPLVVALKSVVGSDEMARSTLTYGVPLLVAVAFFLRPVYAGSALLGIVLVALFYDADGNVLFRTRSFYGVLTVKEYAGGIHSLVNGGILHGEQKLETEADRLVARTYYHQDGPLGQIMSVLNAQVDHPRIAALGLGAGTVAAYGNSGNELTFYELNPQVEKLARNPRYFTYVDDCLKRGCNLQVVLGDGRLQMAKSDERYDLIILDAFSSDAIPVHLLTLEALDIYMGHLQAGGMLAFHISNRYLDLEPVLYNIGRARSLIYAVNKDDGDDDSGRSGSTWVVMAGRDDLIGYLLSSSDWNGLTPKRGIGVWADDYANVAKAFTWY
jgi:hypothetical protein